MVKLHFSIYISSLFNTVVYLESNDSNASCSRLSTFKMILVLSGITSGRAIKLCGAIGVTTRFFEEGEITGPPQLNEYPVDPVGVAMMSPSAK